MRIVRFLHHGVATFGLRRGDHLRAVAGPAAQSWDGLMALLDAGETPPLENADVAPEVASGSTVFLPPVPDTARIICIGLNYADHAREGGHAIPGYPAVFMRGIRSVVGHGQPIVCPPFSRQFDYEAELAVVIGRTAHRVPAAEALGCVVGYTCFNDGSLRDFQRKSSQWTMGKNFDRSGAMGPDLVTADELPGGPGDLGVRARLNGRLLQDGNTREMIFPVPELIEILTRVMTLVPGDVIATGTPAGVGFARDPAVFMAPGDVCEIEIGGIGILRNPVVAEEGAPSPQG